MSFAESLKKDPFEKTAEYLSRFVDAFNSSDEPIAQAFFGKRNGYDAPSQSWSLDIEWQEPWDQFLPNLGFVLDLTRDVAIHLAGRDAFDVHVVLQTEPSNSLRELTLRGTDSNVHVSRLSLEILDLSCTIKVSDTEQDRAQIHDEATLASNLVSILGPVENLFHYERDNGSYIWSRLEFELISEYQRRIQNKCEETPAANVKLNKDHYDADQERWSTKVEWKHWVKEILHSSLGDLTLHYQVDLIVSRDDAREVFDEGAEKPIFIQVGELVEDGKFNLEQAKLLLGGSRILEKDLTHLIEESEPVSIVFGDSIFAPKEPDLGEVLNKAANEFIKWLTK